MTTLSDKATIKATLPALFAQPEHIGRYGDSAQGGQRLDDVSVILEKGSLSRLAAKIGEIVEMLKAADPQKISRKPSFFAQFLGKHLEQMLLYQKARQDLDAQMMEARVLVHELEGTIAMLKQVQHDHQTQTQRLRLYIEAGEEFLNEHPEIGQPENPALEFDRPRERFARKITNMAALLSSYEMSTMQIKLAIAQAIDMLDRYHEIADVLLPVWRQHSLALITTEHMSPEMVSQAVKAHRALMDGLRHSLDGLRS